LHSASVQTPPPLAAFGRSLPLPACPSLSPAPALGITRTLQSYPGCPPPASVLALTPSESTPRLAPPAPRCGRSRVRSRRDRRGCLRVAEAVW
jgi:hypothetical protein